MQEIVNFFGINIVSKREISHFQSRSKIDIYIIITKCFYGFYVIQTFIIYIYMDTLCRGTQDNEIMEPIGFLILLLILNFSYEFLRIEWSTWLLLINGTIQYI